MLQPPALANIAKAAPLDEVGLYEAILDAGAITVSDYRDVKLLEYKAPAGSLEEARALRLRLRIHDHLQRLHGKVLHERVAKGIHGICIHFVDGTIAVRFVERVEGYEPAYQLLEAAEHLYKQARNLGQTQESREMRETAYNVVTHAMAALEAQSLALASTPKGGPPPVPRDLKLYDRLLADLQVRLAAAQARSAKIVYFRGMLLGTAILPLGGALLMQSATLLWGGLAVPPMLVAVALAGAMGAVLSALSRLVGDEVRLEWGTGRFLLQAFGACRPALGALFGLASYLVLAGKIVPWEVPAAQAQPYFFAGIAFLAGFSERFAKDMLPDSPTALAPAPR